MKGSLGGLLKDIAYIEHTAVVEGIVLAVGMPGNTSTAPVCRVAFPYKSAFNIWIARDKARGKYEKGDSSDMYGRSIRIGGFKVR